MPSILKTKYEVELLCDYEQWWRYNVYMMVVAFDKEEGEGVFYNLIDKIYDVNYGGEDRGKPDGYRIPRVISLTTGECRFIEIYAYVVANTFPTSEVIRDSPSFNTVLRVKADGDVLEQKTYEVNQWGGLTIVALRVEK